MNDLSRMLAFTDEVTAALHSGAPVLALESTLVTHGMPWPRNLETARAAERAARAAGAVPATIALLEGRARIGLSAGELERLARIGPDSAKCSRRDIAPLLQRGATAGTTVAATLIFARLAGISLFATGGIGGVHRGAAASFDVSADLRELGRTPVAVVCAGPKAILDIGLTLEFLETEGVPVIGYRTGELPAFWSRDSGHPVDYRLDSARAIAQVIDLQSRLGLAQGLVVANPVPAEAAIDRERIQAAIGQALDEAGARGMQGAGVTPWLLQRVEALTGGDSLRANVALVENNARLGAEIAVALSDLRRGA